MKGLRKGKDRGAPGGKSIGSGGNPASEMEQGQVLLAAMESAANGIIITDTDGIVRWVNPAFTRLTGYTYDESVGNDLKILNSGVHDSEFFRSMWTRIKNGEVWHDEMVNRRKDGSLYYEEMTITPVVGENGQISRFVAIKQDISARKQVEKMALTEKKRMDSELDVAKDIQMSMLPRLMLASQEREDIGTVAKLIPAREVGGDFYFYYWIDDENFCFFAGDVSGKGVPAALFMAVTTTLLKAGSATGRSTAEILAQVNRELSRDNDNTMFVTVFIGILNTTTGYMVYSNAGHCPVYILDRDSLLVNKLTDLHGIPLGAMEGTEYKEAVIRLNRGETLLIYTDGVTEARNELNELYSEGNLTGLLKNAAGFSPEKLVNMIIDEVRKHEEGSEQADDITLLAITFREPTSDSIIDYLFTSMTNRIENISALIGDFEQFALKHQVPSETVHQISIVFDELLSNTIKYAYRDELHHEIEIKIRFYKEKLTVTIMDDGIPFNPFDQSDPDTSLPIADRGIGGLGVHLVKFLVDDYSYEYKKLLKKNSVHFAKHI
jgi:sigma-B regulation protein RsbU (phosphoserine phosphatase)